MRVVGVEKGGREGGGMVVGVASWICWGEKGGCECGADGGILRAVR